MPLLIPRCKPGWCTRVIHVTPVYQNYDGTWGQVIDGVDVKQLPDSAFTDSVCPKCYQQWRKENLPTK